VVSGTTLIVLLLLLMLMSQVSDFTQRLPEFQANFRDKLHNLKVQDPDAPRGPFARLTDMLHALSTEIQGENQGDKVAQPVRIVGDRWSGFGLLPSLAGPVTSLLGRMLARDNIDAADLLKKQLALEDKTREVVLDEVVLPAMNRARQDADRGQLSEEDIDDLADRMGQLLEEVFGELPAPSNSAQTVLACAGADRLDELAIQCFERVMPAGLVRVHRVPATAMAGDVLAEFAEHKPAAVLLSLFPPTGNARTRYLAKRLDQTAPETPIIAGVWSSMEANDPLPVQLSTSGVLHVGTSLAEVRSLIVPVVQVRPHLVRQAEVPALPS
jgi:hypothetical protein